jgi:hypothetical protein
MMALQNEWKQFRNLALLKFPGERMVGVPSFCADHTDSRYELALAYQRSVSREREWRELNTDIFNRPGNGTEEW